MRIDRASAVLDLNGCLAETSYKALLPIIRRSASLFTGIAVTVDLSQAQHIEVSALDQLQLSTKSVRTPNGAAVVVSYTVPVRLLSCPVAGSYPVLAGRAS
ncbi:hypothetical protein [Arthrobacter sp. H5]|uniref:hypothetical protein n=1 Tax=Arthrobacter sp. H5 TaxID=1267973 RepID=UPI0004869507|nr:hypothetical protein [Arthrobacter sp. H5]